MTTEMIAYECRWNQDEICTNADCPMCCDFCPVPDTSDVCKHEDRHELTYAERLDEGERFDVDEKDGM